MTETSPIEANPVFPGRSVALRLGAGLLVGLGLVLTMVLRDNAQRSTLETVVRASALGDTHYVRLPEPWPEPPPALASLRGQPLFPAGLKRHEKRELDLEVVTRDEATGLTIYQARRKRKDKGEKKSSPAYFLKLGPGVFLKVMPAGPGK